jgi:CHAT domain-containing protein
MNHKYSTARVKLDQAQMAYLSACHAANNRNLALLDEAIHMAGACQLAGFPTVIGTLWRISDMYSATVAESLYRAMFISHDELEIQNAARSLHFAVRKLRDETSLRVGSKIFLDPITWAPYIHVGV